MPIPTLTEFIDRPFLFRDRPISVPGDMRAVWRLPVILMMVRSCRSEKATHEQLHVLSWALRSSEGPATLNRFLEGQLRPEEAVVRFEPALDRAIALAEGFDLLAREGGRYWTVTEQGRRFLQRLDATPDVLEAERAVLDSLSDKLTQAAVARMLRRG